MDFLKDLWGYIRTHKKLMFLPSIGILIVAALLSIIANSSVISQFIYAMF